MKIKIYMNEYYVDLNNTFLSINNHATITQFI